MGKLSIIGRAEKEYKCDRREISIRFQAKASGTKEAAKKVTEQYTDFISFIKEKEIPSECIQTGGISIKTRIPG